MKKNIITLAAAVRAAAFFSFAGTEKPAVDFSSPSAVDADYMTAVVSDWLGNCGNPDTIAVKELATAATARPETALAFSQALENVLYSSGPLRSEELYVRFLRAMLDTRAYPDSTRLQWLLEVTAKNAPGTRAADFPLEFSDGTSRLLSETVDKPTLLFFYDPDCDHCREVAARLNGIPELSACVNEGTVQVVAVCPDAADNWREASSWLPAGWLCATDNGAIDEDELYIFDSYPIVYLLDENACVICKNAEAKEIVEQMRYLKSVYK
ncbi:MAG: redoxin domain-containing protein [Muribaculaceae bacterium]|nr:redoxin domain-containing protein [Muribaculaceae bacterium]